MFTGSLKLKVFILSLLLFLDISASNLRRFEIKYITFLSLSTSRYSFVVNTPGSEIIDILLKLLQQQHATCLRPSTSR